MILAVEYVNPKLVDIVAVTDVGVKVNVDEWLVTASQELENSFSQFGLSL